MLVPATVVTSTLHALHTSWDNIALAKQGGDIYLQCTRFGFLWQHPMVWTLLVLHDLGDDTKERGRSSISQLPPSECGNAPGKKDHATQLGWIPLRHQTQLAGWVPAALRIVWALPAAATTPVDKSSHNTSEAEFAATCCFLRKNHNMLLSK